MENVGFTAPDPRYKRAIVDDHEYLLVSDKTSEVIKSGKVYTEIKSVASMIRKAGGEVTIFKAIKG